MMRPQKALSKLFEEEPSQWGLRGDPHLWREMKEIVDSYDYPITEEQLTSLLEQLFQQLTGTSVAGTIPRIKINKSVVAQM